MTEAQLNDQLVGVCFYQAIELLKKAGASDYLIESISTLFNDEYSDEATEAAARLRGDWDDDAN